MYAMWKIITTAISAFLFLGNINTQGCVAPKDYIPREFWDNSDEVTKVLQVVVPEYMAWYWTHRIRYECATAGHMDRAEMIAERTYPHMKMYVENKNLTAPTLEEFITSIGLQYIPPNFYELSEDERLKILKKPHLTHDVLAKNTYTFLDYVGGLLGRPVYTDLTRLFLLYELRQKFLSKNPPQ
jgi:hypothetical protein